MNGMIVCTSPFVGYRVDFTPRLCLYSLFRLHNETLNVYTHLVPSFVFLMTWYGYYTISSLFDTLTVLEISLISLFYFSAFICFFVSACYHLFGCCNHHIYHRLYQCDLSGE